MGWGGRGGNCFHLLRNDHLLCSEGHFFFNKRNLFSYEVASSFYRPRSRTFHSSLTSRTKILANYLSPSQTCGPSRPCGIAAGGLSPADLGRPKMGPGTFALNPDSGNLGSCSQRSFPIEVQSHFPVACLSLLL